MFPLEEIDAQLVHPYIPSSFLTEILAPEVGLRLIMEDQHLDVNLYSDKEKAAQVMLESASYGTFMFPYDDPEEKGKVKGRKGKKDQKRKMNNIGEDLVHERAKKRRKQIEVEDQKEMQLH